MPPPFSTTGLTTDEIYRKVDEEIFQLQDHLTSLKTFRNSLSPISKTPVELLSRIFVHAHECGNVSESKDLTTRFSISWVCRRLRSVALGTPSLWATVARDNRKRLKPVDSEFVRELVARGRHLNLSVDLFSPSKDVLSTCFSSISKIQHLRVQNGSENIDFGGLFSEAAPILTSLDITSFTLSCAKFPPVACPQLAFLTLRKCKTLDLDSLASQTMTKLHILEPQSRESPTSILGLLSALPNLTELMLVDCFSREDGNLTDNPILLPHLQDVTIKDARFSTVFCLLACLDVPQASITLIWPESRDISALHDLTWPLRHYLGKISLDIHRLTFHHNDPDFSFTISGASHSHCHSFQFPGQGLDFADIEINYNNFHLAELQYFSTNGFTLPILKSLGALPKLTTVALTGSPAVQRFINWLARGTGDNIPFRPLETLILCDLQDAKELLRCGRVLKEIIKTRGSLALKLVNCTVRAVGISKFKKLVGDTSVI
ncbi:hypothetical protein BDN72DRAFT_847463 [Pluteus cervinus]|uniref:Uncharacterized protein n=1 Tax=Pluteus cervinus TaxID=181527 RepID=A0ACD3ACY3_9AGAR|nr:hypothetical protein BDN72DRAFT_847463 [Pluteus cervinus]